VKGGGRERERECERDRERGREREREKERVDCVRESRERERERKRGVDGERERRERNTRERARGCVREMKDRETQTERRGWGRDSEMRGSMYKDARHLVQARLLPLKRICFILIHTHKTHTRARARIHTYLAQRVAMDEKKLLYTQLLGGQRLVLAQVHVAHKCVICSLCTKPFR
jgi:hypothetical protein